MVGHGLHLCKISNERFVIIFEVSLLQFHYIIIVNQMTNHEVECCSRHLTKNLLHDS